MILKLRNRHRRVWKLLAVILPLGFIAALVWRPADGEKNVTSMLYLGSAEQADNLDEVAEGKYFLAYTNQNRSGLILLKKESFSSPYGMIYLGQKDSEDPLQWKLLGRVTTDRQYQYQIQNASTDFDAIIIYDIIQNTIIEKIVM